jgi:hypothetical protein
VGSDTPKSHEQNMPWGIGLKAMYLLVLSVETKQFGFIQIYFGQFGFPKLGRLHFYEFGLKDIVS